MRVAPWFLWTPLIVVVVALYNVVGFVWGGHVMDYTFVNVPLASGTYCPLQVGDLFVTAGIFAMFVEMLKSTQSGMISMIDHGLSLVLMIACILEFALVAYTGTSTFFLIMLLTIVDTVGGYIISQSVAGRSINLGNLIGGSGP